MERKLATIQTIKDLHEIPGADFIIEATVMGWHVVVKKDEYRVGDKCIFCEIDAVLPEGKEWAEFMRPRKFRVKTCKLRGVLSQGLVLPIGILSDFDIENCNIGDDVTELLGIKKYEIPEVRGAGAIMGCSAGLFPSFLANKTDEIRVQSIPEVIEDLKGNDFYISVKCDGTSGTYVHDDEKFYACSRNFERKENPENIYWRIAKKYNLQEILKANPFLAIQGEIVGPGIQGNRLMLSDIDFMVFNIYDSKNRKYFDYCEFVSFCFEHSLKTVPIEKVVLAGDDFDYSLQAWLKLAEGKYPGTKNHREGIVVRTIKEKYSPTLLGRLSFKVINNSFLLKEEK